MNAKVFASGTELEKSWKEIAFGVEKMKRNKKTVVLAHEELTPLTEHILAKMGKEGALIRRRLKSFYRDRALTKEPLFDQPLETPGLEAST